MKFTRNQNHFVFFLFLFVITFDGTPTEMCQYPIIYFFFGGRTQNFCKTFLINIFPDDQAKYATISIEINTRAFLFVFLFIMLYLFIFFHAMYFDTHHPEHKNDVHTLSQSNTRAAVHCCPAQ